MPSNVEVLMEMGFPQNRAEKALARTNYKGVQEAMDWLFNHSEDADIDDPFEAPKGNVLASTDTPASGATGSSESAEAEGSAAAQPQSLKCDECGKQLRSEIDIQAHAARTGHSSFSESTEEVKPLTAEEKARQMTILEERKKQKRKERTEREKAEAKDKEKIRRSQGKDISVAKFDMEQKEMRQLAEQKRREKAEDKAAKQRALDDIRRDKEARVAAREAARAGTSAPSLSEPAASPVVSVTPAVKKEYTECRLQIRLPDGQPMTQTFKPDESLAAVRLYVTVNKPELAGTFTFMTSFPRKVYDAEDMEKPLSSLGLVPSAVIMVTRL